uniref:DUF4218 domain-containing protein n=1 Tax=Lactuca sativa TaxID=4236 RepID=A0A9R1VIU6_LACSA|nr:hypothetical protein LSAT_V11C500277330 [Lactuca sativa]
MEHLPVHFPYETKIAGPVQYRWMYPFERFVYCIKMYVAIFVSLEGFIVNAYLLREASIFCSHYFETGIPTHNRRLPRNDDGGGNEQPDDNIEILDIFSYPGYHYGRFSNRMLSDEELHVVHTYILLNEDKIKHYIGY